MKTNARFHCKEIVGTITSGEYELPEGTTISEFIKEAERLGNYTLSDEEKDFMGFMINGQGADWNTVLHDGDMLRVLYRIIGG